MSRIPTLTRRTLILFAFVHLLVLGSVFLTAGTGESSDSTGSTPTAEQARTVFERFRALDGDWNAASTKGWEGTNEYTVESGGSVVVSTTRFPDAPEKTMRTMFYLDGDRLLLTHYCEAHNQPRLVLSAVSDEGRRATFTFLDATNLPSRDHGHMDKAVYRFLDGNDRFSSRWTWYAKGREEWLEEIVYERAPTPGWTP